MSLPLTQHTFTVSGKNCFVIYGYNKPGPWVWYAPTITGVTPDSNEDWLFQRLIDAGVSVAGIDVGETYGNAAGRTWFTDFYNEMVTNQGYSAKPCMHSRSRGGLMNYNWAEEHASCLAGMTGVYPVCDPLSFPGVDIAAAAYGMTNPQFLAQLDNCTPTRRGQNMVSVGHIPILHLHGDNDLTVPIAPNSVAMLAHYKPVLGGIMELQIIQGAGHDSDTRFFQSQAVLDFLIKYAFKGADDAAPRIPAFNTRTPGNIGGSSSQIVASTQVKTFGPRR